MPLSLHFVDERRDDGPVVTAFIGASEQGVLAVEGQRADRALDGIVVEIDTTIIQEQPEPVPTGERVADRLAKLTFGADLTVAGIKIKAQIVDDHLATIAAGGASVFGGGAADLGLDGIK